MEAVEFRSAVWINRTGGQWDMSPLPILAQAAPMQGIVAKDINQDGYLDLVTVGNAYDTEVLTGRYDAGIGSVLLGNGTGQFTYWPNRQHGFVADGDARDIVSIPDATGNTIWVVAQNRGVLTAFLQKRATNY